MGADVKRDGEKIRRWNPSDEDEIADSNEDLREVIEDAEYQMDDDSAGH